MACLEATADFISATAITLLIFVMGPVFPAPYLLAQTQEFQRKQQNGHTHTADCAISHRNSPFPQLWLRIIRVLCNSLNQDENN
jgi:hypothetical protein